MIRFETGVQIRRPIEEVFAYLSDPLNLPQWNSAVQAVRKSASGTETYALERALPAGRAVDTIEVEAVERPRELAVRAPAGPTPFNHRYRLSAQRGETVVRLDAEVELPGVGPVLERLARRTVRSGVDHNLATLKHLLEAGGQ